MNVSEPPLQVRLPLVAALGAVVILSSVLVATALYQTTFLLAGFPTPPPPPDNMDWIEPVDVYQRVGVQIQTAHHAVHVLYLVACLIGLLFLAVVAQICLKVWIFRPLVYEMWISRLTSEERLKLSEQHGVISDSKWARMEKALIETEKTLERANNTLQSLDQRAEVTAKQAEETAVRAEELKHAVARVEHQTNSLAAQNAAMAGREGVREGRDQMQHEAADRGDVRGTEHTSPTPTMRDQINEVGADIKDVKKTADRIEEAVRNNNEESER